MKRPRLICGVAALLLSVTAHPQSFPTKPIRMIVPYTAGGGTDLIARPLAQALSESLGHQVVIDNRGGANGSIGMELAAKAAPDGYTLVLALTAQLAINPAFYPKLSYDPVRDYAPIAFLGTAPYMLTVNPSMPAKTLKELIALAKSRPGQLTFASSGAGGIPHLAGELLKTMSGIEIVHVPYKGGGPALADVVGGHVQMTFTVIPSAMPHVKAGRLRAIAVTGRTRFRSAPNIPAIAETLPGYEMSTAYGVLAPARTHRDVVMRLNAEITKALAAPALANELLAAGFQASAGSPEQLAAHIKSELVRWADIVKRSGAKAE